MTGDKSLLSNLTPPVRFALTIAFAFAGGALFQALGLPAPWLAGAMLATAVAGLARFPVLLPHNLRYVAFAILGLQVGASFTRDSIASIAQWPVSLIILALSVAVLVTAGYLLYTRIYKWDGKTAYFASKPGALAMTLVMAEHYGADLKRVAATQSLRLFLLMAILPVIALKLNEGTVSAVPAASAMGLATTIIVLAVGAVAGYALHRLGAPGGVLIGAMLANAVLHLTGAVSGAVPNVLLIPAFVILGTMVGERFADVGMALLRRILAAGLAGFVVSLIISTAGALLATYATGLPLMATLLAFAPGGLEVMVILAFVLGVNPAFVATHQLARYLGLNLSLPVVSQLLLGKASK